MFIIQPPTKHICAETTSVVPAMIRGAVTLHFCCWEMGSLYFHDGLRGGLIRNIQPDAIGGIAYFLLQAIPVFIRVGTQV